MRNRSLAVVLLAVGLSTILYLHNSGGIGASSSRIAGFSAAMVAMAFAGVIISRRGVPGSALTEPASEESDRLLLVRALSLPILALIILVAPIYYIDRNAGLITTAIAAAVVSLVVIRDQRAATRRGVPREERLKRRHSRTLIVRASVERALESAENVLETVLNASVSERTDRSVRTHTTMSTWESGQDILVHVLGQGDDSCQVVISSEPAFGALDGGKSWVAVAEVSRRLEECLGRT